MQQTLFTIPHDWFNGPIFWSWLAIGFVWLVGLWLRKGRSEAVGFLPFYLIAAAVIRFLLPVLEIDGVNPADPLGPLVKSGLAVRGYGVCLLLAILAGAGITLYRARQAGFDPDLIVQLAVWMIVAGVVGARLFYIIQKHDEFFQGGSIGQTLVNLFDATKGGLVVYGSLIGGSLAGLVFFWKTGLPVFRTADLIAPGMVLGLAIGRVGCLMNGCCFGGICDTAGLPKIHFPPGSPPYMQHLVDGELLGMKTKRLAVVKSEEEIFSRDVTEVEKDSLAEQLGIKSGDQVSIVPLDDLRIRFIKSQQNRSSSNPVSAPIQIANSNLGFLNVPASQLPDRSLGVHPAQIYSAVDAFLLSVLLWFFWYVRKADGQVFGLMLILHGVSRFLLELVREDEIGAFGTALTISQWLSLVWIAVGIALFAGRASGSFRPR